MDVIDRKRVIKKIRHEISEQENTAIQGEDIDIGVIVGLKIAAQIIEKQPSAEKTGRWVPIVSYTKDGREKTQWGCSECGQGMFQFGQRFCSNCGVRMEE